VAAHLVACGVRAIMTFDGISTDVVN